MGELSKTTINGVSYDFKDAGAARQSHSHTKSQITDFPTSMPASDVAAWAKASTKPTYTQDEVGDGSTYKRVTSTEKSTWNNKGTYSKPSGGIPKTDLASAVQTSLGKADTALQSFTESDPTVPSWAKQSSKPSYTASEVGAIATSAKGAANGVASLDSAGKVPSSQLPSYVDDVLEYSAKSSFPSSGEAGKIYVDTSTNKTYRWSGSAYVEISASLALGETSSTAYRGDRGKAAYDHSQTTSGNPHNVTKGDVGLGNVGNFKAVSTVASQGLSSTEQANARANIGAGTSSFSGSYNDLSNKPTIPTKVSQLTNDSGYTTNTGTVTGVKVGSTSYSPSSGIVSLPAYPTTLPASDVSSWAKASSKPTYTASEVGAATSSHTHGLSLATDTGASSISLAANTKYKLTAGGSTYVFTTPPDNNTTYSSKSAASGGTDVSLCTTGEKYTWNSKANGSHTHNYAGSSSAGGAATSANKLNTNAGSVTQPVYFSNGVPAATTYSLGKSVPSNAVFTDTHRAIKVDGTQVLASNSTALNFIGTGHVHVAHDSSNPGNITFYEENWLTFVDLEVALGDLTWTASSSSPGMYYSGNLSVYRSGTKPAFSFILGASIMDFNALPVAFISVGLSGTSSIWLLSNTNNFQSYTKLNLRIFGLISFGEA